MKAIILLEIFVFKISNCIRCDTLHPKSFRWAARPVTWAMSPLPSCSHLEPHETPCCSVYPRTFALSILYMECSAQEALGLTLTSFKSMFMFHLPSVPSRHQVHNIIPFYWLSFLSSSYHQLLSVSSVAQLCPTLCHPMDCSTPGLPVHHQLLEFTQTHVHQVGDVIQLSHPLSSPSPAPNPSQHQGLFQ